jgi:hypothetical protein
MEKGDQMELIAGALVVATAIGMLGVMAVGYVIMLGLLGLALVGGVMFFFQTLITAYFDETVDPFHMIGNSHVDINFIEKEIDLRLVQKQHLDPADSISYVPTKPSEAPHTFPAAS